VTESIYNDYANEVNPDFYLTKRQFKKKEDASGLLDDKFVALPLKINTFCHVST
jgi:hypothetical protein